MRHLKKFCIIVIATFWSATAFAYTSPGKPTGLVNDFAGILSQETKTQLENSLRVAQQETTNEIAVVTVPSLGDETVETYAVALFEEWSIGKKGKDNGILLLVAPTEKKVRIEVGYGLEGVLTDTTSSLIIQREMLPAFKANDFAGGIEKGVQSIIKVTQGEYEPSAPNNKSFFGDVTDIFFVFFAILIFFINVIVFAIKAMAGSKATWPGAVGGGVIGLAAGWILGNSFAFTAGSTLLVALLGLGIDHLFSSNAAMQTWAQKINTRSHTFWGGGGKGGSGGFGGFGGGGSGGGGSSGSW